MITSQRFGLNPTTAAPEKIATTARTLGDTYAGYAAVTSGSSSSGTYGSPRQ